MSEYIVKGAEPNETVLHHRTKNGYEGWMWLPVREEIVRCRDCYYFTDSPAWPDAYECDYINRGVEPDGFCAWGERRDA